MTFLHSGDLGDIAYAMPTIKHLGGGTVYLTSRPGTREQMTPARFEFIRPLLLAQPYVQKVEMHKGQEVKYDFTEFRSGWRVHVTLLELQRRHVIPIGPRPDFARKWFQVTPEQHGRPVFARSARYNNPEWEKVWPSMYNSEKPPMFVGTKEEHVKFSDSFGSIEYRQVSTARELAEVIAGSSLFVGNQSFPYSIADGLKTSRILEVWPKSRDCCYPSPGSLFIEKADQWPGTRKTKLILALQCCPLDYEAAVDLAQIIEAIEDERREDIEAAVCVRDDVTQGQAEKLVSILSRKFKTHLVRSRRNGRGWPDGCNDLWQTTMVEMGRMSRALKTTAEAVITIEPDCIPGSKDWLNRLVEEWRNVKRAGKLLFGAKGLANEQLGMHINGNMVITVDACVRFPQLQSSRQAWDIDHRGLICEIGLDSNLIINRYGEKNELTVEEVQGIEKNGVRPAIIHGIKNASGRNAVRATLLK